LAIPAAYLFSSPIVTGVIATCGKPVEPVLARLAHLYVGHQPGFMVGIDLFVQEIIEFLRTWTYV
jgi:hypothetical protein